MTFGKRRAVHLLLAPSSFHWISFAFVALPLPGSINLLDKMFERQREALERAQACSPTISPDIACPPMTIRDLH